MRRFAALTLLALLGLVAPTAHAHEFRMSILELRVDEDDAGLEATARFSPSYPHLALEVAAGEGCALSEISAPGDETPGRYRLRCPPEAEPALQLTAPPGMPRGEVMVRLMRPGEAMQVRTRRSGEAIRVRDGGDAAAAPTGEASEALSEVAWIYAQLGVEHILLGPDHLLFVLGLLLLVQGARTLLFTITAFTLAHSLTLALSVTGALTLPPAPVEVVIALSILLLAVELAQPEGVETWTRRAPWSAALLFGLLHGFGFAGALTDIGLPEGQRAVALATFNVGVELGQLLFVAALALLHRLALRGLPERALRVPAAYLLGSLAVAWTLERITSL